MGKLLRKCTLLARLIVFAGFFMSGCAFMSSILDSGPIADRPRYDKVLVYNRPFDYTYLKTIEALNTFPNWILEETEKEVGLIVLRNTQFGHLFDRDKEVARFRVTRISRTQTSVALDPDSQHLRQGGDFLDRIDAVMAQGAVSQPALTHSEQVQVTEAVP